MRRLLGEADTVYAEKARGSSRWQDESAKTPLLTDELLHFRGVDCDRAISTTQRGNGKGKRLSNTTPRATTMIVFDIVENGLGSNDHRLTTMIHPESAKLWDG